MQTFSFIITARQSFTRHEYAGNSDEFEMIIPERLTRWIVKIPRPQMQWAFPTGIKIPDDARLQNKFQPYSIR